MRKFKDVTNFWAYCTDMERGILQRMKKGDYCAIIDVQFEKEQLKALNFCSDFLKRAMLVFLDLGYYVGLGMNKKYYILVWEKDKTRQVWDVFKNLDSDTAKRYDIVKKQE